MTKEQNKQYVPFGLEWYKEMRKLNKDTIISLVEKNCKERDKLKEQTKELQQRVEQLQFELKAADSVNEQLQSKIDELDKANFWNRLKSFISNVQVNDPMSEEEKNMIIYVCNNQLTSSIND